MKFAFNCPFSDSGLMTSADVGRSFFYFLDLASVETDGGGSFMVNPCQKEIVGRSRQEIEKLSRWLEPSKVIQYLKGREKEGGGFSFAPELYPDIEDTYYAVKTLKLLKADVDRDKTANYLKSIDWKEVAFARAVYMLLYIHLSLDIDLPPQLMGLSSKDWSGFAMLDAQYFSDEMGKLLGRPLKPLHSSSPFQFQANESLQTLRKKVSILLDRDINFDRQQIIRWVQSSQNGDGGFGFYPETTSYIENTYCALEILSKLGSSPMQSELCRKYILGCQTKGGGFSRAPASFPFIESTYYAVAGLFLLEGIGGIGVDGGVLPAVG
jgi:hypothetical protein